jgi:hypothetical protein
VVLRCYSRAALRRDDAGQDVVPVQEQHRFRLERRSLSSRAPGTGTWAQSDDRSGHGRRSVRERRSARARRADAERDAGRDRRRSGKHPDRVLHPRIAAAHDAAQRAADAHADPDAHPHADADPDAYADHDGADVPSAEFDAALLAVVIGDVLRLAFADRHRVPLRGG